MALLASAQLAQMVELVKGVVLESRQLSEQLKVDPNGLRAHVRLCRGPRCHSGDLRTNTDALGLGKKTPNNFSRY